MNRKYFIFIAGIVLVASMASCVKSRNSLNTDFSGLQPLVELKTPPPNRAGLLYFGSASLNFSGDPDTTLFYVNLASVDALNKDLKVTVDIDNAAMTTYNATSSIQYKLFPDSTFSFTEKQLTISAGQHVAPVHVVFYPSKIDPSESYMLPLSIKDAQGVNISANFGTIYFHVIGNPLAGNYLQDFYRWNGTQDTTTAPNSTVTTNVPVVITPENATTLLLPESYLQTFVGTSAGISLSFTDNAGVLSNFSVALNSATLDGLAAGGFTVLIAPKLVSYQIVGDASTKYAGSTFRTYWSVQNSSGGVRTLIDNFVKQ